MTKTDTTTTPELRVVNAQEGTDGLGTPFASVAVVQGDLYAQHSSFSRGGCLAAGTVVVRNLRTAASKEVDVTSWASDSDAHVAYLLGLAAKHVGEER